MRNVKFIAVAGILVLAMSACKKDVVSSNVATSTKYLTEFSADLGQVRTSLADDKSVLWEKNDYLAIINVKSDKIYRYALSSAAGKSHGTFSPVGEPAEYESAEELKAVYPAYAASVKEGVITLRLNDTEYTQEELSPYGIKNWNGNAPYTFDHNDLKVSNSVTADANGMHFTFTQLAAWCTFKIDFTEGKPEYQVAEASEISINTDAFISGTCTVSFEGGTPKLVPIDDKCTKSFTRSYTTRIPLSAPITFEAMLIPGWQSQVNVKVGTIGYWFDFYATPKTLVAQGTTCSFPITMDNNFKEGEKGTDYAYTVTEREIPGADGNLAALDGPSNCYLVKEADKTFKFPVNVKGNGVAPGEEETSINIEDIKGYKIIWKEGEDFIAGDISLEGDSMIHFTTKSGVLPSGTALIGVYSTPGCDDGTCLWSWLIWANASAESVVPTGHDIEWMNYNLGASGYEDGLYYQWGRKDPFTVARAAENLQRNLPDVTAELAVANPTVFYTNATTKNWCSTSSSAYDTMKYWDANREKCITKTQDGSPKKEDLKKTMYDPCPPGYMVPTITMLKTWKSGSPAATWDNGYYVLTPIKLYAGHRWIGPDGTTLPTSTNPRSCYWSCDPVYSSDYPGNNTSAVLWSKFESFTLNYLPDGAGKGDGHGIWRHFGNQVRCVKL